MIVAKDNKDMYGKYIHPIVELIEIMRTQGLGEWLPFSVAEPQDMKSLQLCLAQGGEAKGQSYFCHLCQINNDDITSRQKVCCSGYGSLEKCCPRSIALSCKRGTICSVSGSIMSMTEAPCFHHPMIRPNFNPPPNDTNKATKVKPRQDKSSQATEGDQPAAETTANNQGSIGLTERHLSRTKPKTILQPITSITDKAHKLALANWKHSRGTNIDST
jgi:hypothetical protein